MRKSFTFIIPLFIISLLFLHMERALAYLWTPTAPAAPSGVNIALPYCNADNDPYVLINWTDNSDNEAGFEIYRGTTSDFVPDISNFVNLNIQANRTEFLDQSPANSSTYYYKIRAINVAGNSDYAVSPAVTTPFCLAKFYLMTISGVQGYAMINVGNTAQFNGAYDPDGLGGPIPGAIVANASISWSSLNPAIATVDSTGLATGVGIGLAFIRGTYLGNTAEYAVDVRGGPPPSGISSLSVVQFCAGSFDPAATITWDDNSSNETGFEIYRGYEGQLPYLSIPPKPSNLIAIVGANITSYTDTTALPNTGYMYGIRVVNGFGGSFVNNATIFYSQACQPTFALIPASPSIFTGGTQQFDGNYRSYLGAPLITPPRSDIGWSSTNLTKATISGSGLATGVDGGNTTIIGVYGGMSTGQNLTVMSFTLNTPSFLCSPATYIPDLNLSWQAAAGASSYAVYFKGYKNGLFTGNEMTDGKFSTVSTSLNTPYLSVGPNVYSMFSSLNSLAGTSPFEAGLMGLVIKAFDGVGNVIAVSNEQKIFVRSPDNRTLGQIVSPPAVPTANCFLTRAVLGGNTFNPDYPPVNGAVWWEGSVNYNITHLNTGIVYNGSSVNKVFTIPNTFNDVAERFTIQYNSGGPGIALARITAVFEAGGNFESGQVLDISYNSIGVWAGGFNLHFSNTYSDCGLRVDDGTGVVKFACESTLTSSLRVRKGGTTYGVVLVNTSDSNASKVRIKTPAGVKALRKFP